MAKHLVELFNQCINGNFSEVERLREKSLTSQSASRSCAQGGDDDESGSEEEEEEEEMDEDAMDTDKPAPSPPSGPDEDGWETVRTKK